MITPIQPATNLPATQPAANPQLSEKIREFYEWFSPLTMADPKPTGSSPAPAVTAAVSPASASGPASSSSQPSSLFDASVTGTNPDGSINVYNPVQFATASTAQAMAKLVGGQVQAENLSGPLTRTAPELDIVGAGANPLNAGLVADLFNKYGTAPGSYAWQVIDSDLGKTQA
jgi:hypothetical protein